VPSPFELLIWFVCTLLELSVVGCALWRGVFRRYLALNVYMLACAAVSIGRFQILSSHGFTSAEYVYFYYYSDLLLTIGLYCALMSLYAHVFEEMGAERLVRFGALLLLLGTSAFSFLIVEQASNKIVSRFVVELSQNLYFVGLVLTYVLWAAILKLRETRTRLIQIVLSLGVYLSLFAADYALRNLYPSQRSLFISLLQVIGLFLPLTWAYAFWRLPEEARMAPARLAVAPR